MLRKQEEVTQNTREAAVRKTGESTTLPIYIPPAVPPDLLYVTDIKNAIVTQWKSRETSVRNTGATATQTL